MRTKLSKKQEVFALEFATHGNATKAAKNAGYKGNDVTLAAVGYENLRKPQIEQAVAAEKQKLAEAETLPTPEQITLALAREAGMNGVADTTPASRVSALRTLADISGMLEGRPAELPPALDAFFTAVARGMGNSGKQEAIEVQAREVQGLEAGSPESGDPPGTA